jgi:hypothetical protein
VQKQKNKQTREAEMINKDTIAKILTISLPTIAGGSLLIAGYFYKPQPINLDRDEYLNATKSTKIWTDKDTQELLDKLEEFNKDLCKTYETLYTIAPTEEAIKQAEQSKSVDQIPQLRLYRQLASELEKKEWDIIPIAVAIGQGYPYSLFVEAPNPPSIKTMKVRDAFKEPWLSRMLLSMQISTAILPKCRKYFDEEVTEAFEEATKPQPK